MEYNLYKYTDCYSFSIDLRQHPSSSTIYTFPSDFITGFQSDNIQDITKIIIKGTFIKDFDKYNGKISYNHRQEILLNQTKFKYKKNQIQVGNPILMTKYDDIDVEIYSKKELKKIILLTD